MHITIILIMTLMSFYISISLYLYNLQHRYCPSACMVHQVRCHRGWSLANILNEILKITQSEYDSDLVLYVNGT